MTMAVLRFNCIQPGLEPKEMSARYQAFVDMAAMGDEQGFSIVNLEEHHGADNGWSPSPMLMAGMVVARTKRIGVNFGALLLPLHDPHPRRGGPGRARPDQRRTGHDRGRPRVPAERVPPPPQGLGRSRQADGSLRRHRAEGLDR